LKKLFFLSTLFEMFAFVLSTQVAAFKLTTADRLSDAEASNLGTALAVLDTAEDLKMRQCDHALEFCYECDGQWTFKPCHCYIPTPGPELEEEHGSGEGEAELEYYYYTPEPYSGAGDPCTTPGFGGIMCDIYDAVCDIVIGVAGKVAKKFECVADDALIAGACETAGIGPEDPLSDICAVTFASMFQYACGKAIGEAGKFTKKACKALGGCGNQAALSFEWAGHLEAPKFALE